MSYRIVFLIFTCIFIPVSVPAKTLLIMGDSLSTAYGIPLEAGWVPLLEQRIIKQNLDYKVINSSISGETTLGAKHRLKKLLEKHKPELVIIELGGNDGLRGVSLAEIEKNLFAMIAMIKKYESDVLLVPIQLPPNYGKVHNQRFMSIYESVAKAMDITLSTFILKGIAEQPELMQNDGIHPVQAAQPLMLDNIWPSLQLLMMK